MQKPWEKYGGASSSVPFSMDGPDRAPPPQTGAQAYGDNLSNDQRNVTIANDKDKPRQVRFDQERSLRNDFEGLPEVKAYKTILPMYASAIKAADNPVGDMQIITAWAKTYDPVGSVREGDVATAENAQSLMSKVLATSSNFDGKGRLRPDVRKNFVEEIRNRGSRIGDQFRPLWDNYRQRASAAGLDPDQVFGQNPALPFQAVEAEYLGHQPRLVNQQPQAAMGSGDIGFAGADPQNLPPGAEAFQQQLQQAINGGAFKTPEQIVAFGRAKGFNVSPEQAAAAIKVGQAAVAMPQFAPPDITNVRDGNETLDPMMRGLADVPTFGLSEELGSLVDTVAKGGTYADNLARNNAIRDFDNENNYGARLTGQLAGGLAMPGFGARTIPQMAKVGAGYGGAYGFGSTDGGISQRLGGAAMGAGAGAAMGAGLGATIPMLGRGAVAAGRRYVGPSNARQTALLQAGSEEGVPLNMSDLYPGALNTTATLETIPGASGVIREGIGAGRDAIEGRVAQLGRGGTAREDMGQVAQEAGRGAVDKMNSQAERLYTRAKALAGDTPIEPQQVRQVIAQLVKMEEGTPGGTRAGAVIRQYGDAFESGAPVSIQGARRMRSELLSRLRDDGGLSKREATRITGQIMSGINQDIEASLTRAGKGAAVQAFRDADRFYAQSRDEIETVIEKFVGTDDRPFSAEKTLSLMQNAAGQKGDAQGLGAFMRRMSPEDRKDFAATLVEPLGRGSADEPFSPAKFIQNVRKLSPGARRIIFGADGEKSVQNLIRLSNAKSETVRRLNNSRSGQVGNYRQVISSLIVGVPGGGALLGAATGLNAGTGAVGGAGIVGAGIALSRSMAKAMMNENFTRLLSQAPGGANPAAINNHIGRMRQLAAKDPNVRAVVESIEQRLLRFANDNGTRAQRLAASDGRSEDDQDR